MKQADLGLNLSSKRTRKREFLDQMDKVVPWAELVELIAPHCPQRGRKGRQPYEVGAMLRIHFLQQWFGLSDPAMEEALHEVPLYREFTGLDSWSEPLPDESTILRFRHTLEEHKLADKMLDTVNDILRERGLMMRSGTVVDATLIAAPSSTKNSSGERDPEMHQTKKGNQWYFGAKSHIAVDAASGLVHTTKFTAANVADVTEANSLLHGEEVRAFGDAGYQGVEKRPDAPGDVEWHTALSPGKRRALDKSDPAQALTDQIERVKASIRSKVEHVFRVVKCQFGYRKVRYRGLAKNGSQMTTLYALANLWLVRRKLLALQA
jgi:IS5 family transposase